MICSTVQRNDLVERYLNGKLALEERVDFEDHYFNCDQCFREIEAARSARPVLKETGMRTAPRKSNTKLVWLAAAAIAATILVVTTVILKPSVHTPAPKVEIATHVPAQPATYLVALNQIQPPPYRDNQLRGNESDPGKRAFKSAMKTYPTREWTVTADALTGILKTYPNSRDALYFRAICLLLGGEATKALPEFDQVIALGTATPYEEEARFYRAQALLVNSNASAAQAELEQVMSMHGEYEAKARALLQRQSPTATKPPQ
jgi:hypothetical protein